MALAGLTFDAGVLIAADKNDRRFWALWKRATQAQLRMRVPTVVLAQAWRGHSPLIARCVAACETESFTETRARRTGELLAKARTSDVIDAAVVLSAAAGGDLLITSDPDDLTRLAAAAEAPVVVRPYRSAERGASAREVEAPGRGPGASGVMSVCSGLRPPWCRARRPACWASARGSALSRCGSCDAAMARNRRRLLPSIAGKWPRAGSRRTRSAAA
jgi:hypothetical protein